MPCSPKTDEILKHVLSEISPTPPEQRRAEMAASEVVAKINKALRDKGAKAIVGGSNKKQTQLRNTFEIDVFVLFDYKKYAQNDTVISNLLERALAKSFKKKEKVHGSRDYFQIQIPPYTFEAIPILSISSSRQAKNITDVSPLHAKWVSRNAKNTLNDIRLTKAFMSACGVYGAESYVRGFSGYACEILTIHYGGFLKLLRTSKVWKDKQVIDPEKHYKSKNPLMELNKSKTESPLIIIDPVQPSRNVTAALSRESLNVFVKEAEKFLKHPSKGVFKRKTLSKKELINSKGKETELLLVEVSPEKNKKDVMGAAILGKYELLRKGILENNFQLKKSAWQWDGGKALLWFFISKKYPPESEQRKGPSETDKINSKRFRQKHKKTFKSKGRLFAIVKREFPTPKALAKSIMAKENFKTRINSTEAEWR